MARLGRGLGPGRRRRRAGVGGGSPPPVITTTSLPDALLGFAYSQALAATGGSLPLAWSITAGALPDGLSLDAGTGIISGIPTLSGLFTFTARVIDHHGRIDSKVLSIADWIAAHKARGLTLVPLLAGNVVWFADNLFAIDGAQWAQLTGGAGSSITLLADPSGQVELDAQALAGSYASLRRSVPPAVKSLLTDPLYAAGRVQLLNPTSLSGMVALIGFGAGSPGGQAQVGYVARGGYNGNNASDLVFVGVTADGVNADEFVMSAVALDTGWHTWEIVGLGDGTGRYGCAIDDGPLVLFTPTHPPTDAGIPWLQTIAAAEGTGGPHAIVDTVLAGYYVGPRHYVCVACYGGNQLTRCVPGGTLVFDTVADASPLWGVANDGTYLWTVADATKLLEKRSATTGVVLTTYPTGVLPRGVCVDLTTGTVYVCNYTDGTVTRVVITTGAVSTIAVGGHPVTCAADGAGHVLVVESAGNVVKKIDCALGTVIDTYGAGHLSTPHSIAISGGFAYVTNQGDNSVTKLATATGAVGWNQPCGTNPWGVCVDSTGAWLFVANAGDNTVSKLLTSTGASVGGPIAVGLLPTDCAADASGSVFTCCYTGGSLYKIVAATAAVSGPLAVGVGPARACSMAVVLPAP